MTPSLNCGAFIEETMRSVEQQDYPRVEHIVLDSGSTDETLAILARHPSARVVTTGPQGLSAKVSHGFSIARGDIIGWLNADDFYQPGAISKAVDAFRLNPEVAMVYCNRRYADERSVEIDRERTKQASWREMLARCYVPVESAFFRREVLEQVGPLDTRYPLVNDWDLFLRISKRFPILYVDDWWSTFRIRPGQRSDLYRHDCWIQARRMTKEHGAAYFPLVREYWGPRLLRAGRMVRKGEFGWFGSTLGNYILSFVRHQNTRNKSDY